jgi:twinkle protein
MMAAPSMSMAGLSADLIAPMTPELLARLEAWGFDAEEFLKLDLGVGEAREQPGALAIPFYDGRSVVGVKVRAIGAKGVYGQARHFGVGGIFYNLNCLGDPGLANEPLIVAEGEPGCWAALIAGFPRAVGVPIASPDGRRQPYVEQSEPLWRPVREIILATYDDDAGNTLREDLAHAFGRSRCKWVRYPKGCHDLLGTLRDFGVRGIQETVRRAQWLAVPDIYAMADLPEPPENPAIDTGIVGMREHFRVRRGDLTVVTGVPGHGKTSFVNEVVCRLALAHGWRTIFGSFEQRPVPDHRRALRTFHARKLEKHMTVEERAAADAFIHKHFRFLVPSDETETSLEWLLETMAAAVHRFDPHIVVIDPWNELEHIRPRDMTQTEYTGWAIRALKRFARLRRVHVVIVAHPAKLQRNRGDGKYPMPTLYDIADSAHWYNKPDLGVVIWRESSTSVETSIVVAKSRYHSEIGRPGTVCGIWNEESGRYTIIDDGSMAA